MSDGLGSAAPSPSERLDPAVLRLPTALAQTETCRLEFCRQNQATLQVVAPGIAEALIATAMGLFAAIPAVVAYNRYTAQVESISGSYITFTEEFSSILHRQVYGG